MNPRRRRVQRLRRRARAGGVRFANARRRFYDFIAEDRAAIAAFHDALFPEIKYGSGAPFMFMIRTP